MKIFTPFQKKHELDGNRIVKIEKLLLLLKDAFVKQAHNIRFSDNMSDNDLKNYTIIISDHFNTTKFFNTVVSHNAQWFFNLVTGFATHVILLDKNNRGKLRDRGSIN